MTDTQITSGGPAIPVEKIVSCDQVSIIGDGTSENPLRATGATGTSGAPISIPPHLAMLVNAANFTISAAFIASTAAGALVYSPELTEGQLISALSIRLLGDGAVDLTYTASIIDEDGNNFDLSTGSINNVSGAAWATYALTAFTPYQLAAGEMLVIAFTVSATGLKFGPVILTP